MASTSETGYAKQLAEFEDFTKLLSALGEAYNPPKPELAITNLLEQLNAAKSAMREISAALPPYSAAVDKQNLAFKFLNDRVTRSLNYYKVAISNPSEIDTAKNLADKIRGKSNRAKAVVAADAAAPKSISQSQQSYDSRIENLKQYIDVLIVSGVYNNPGSEIGIDDLNLMLNEMEAANAVVAEAKIPLDVARKKRAVIFYEPVTGIADLVSNAKRYVKATVPKTNPHYNSLTGITFKKRS